nr:Cell morphogenesis protein PAG1 [Polyrhizophydium stewartii]
MLLTLTPWLRNVDLNANFRLDDAEPLSESSLADQATATMVLSNVFYLTACFSDVYVNEIETLWLHLVEMDASYSSGAHMTRQEWDAKRVYTILDFLILVGLDRRNPRFVSIAKKIAVCICRTPACGALIEAVMAKITPKGMVPSNDKLRDIVLQRLVRLEGYFTANLDDALTPIPDRAAFSPGQLAFTLLVEVSIEIGNFALRPHLPVLLHAIFVQLDHFIFLICEQSRSLLINMIQAMLPRDSRRERIDATLTALNLKEGKRLWNYEDVTPYKTYLESVDQLSALALEVLDLFSMVHPTLHQAWGEITLIWGTACPVRHIACRSLQLFRALRPVFSQRMVGEILTRMAATLGDPTDDVQGYTWELLETIQAMVTFVDPPARLAHFPQFVWASVATLHSSHEWEFEKGAKLLALTLAYLDLSDTRIMNLVQTSLPTRWRGEFQGIQSLLLQGMCSAKTERLSLDLINHFVATVGPSTLIDTSNTSRLLFAVLANLPRLMQAFDDDMASMGARTAAGAAGNNPGGVAASLATSPTGALLSPTGLGTTATSTAASGMLLGSLAWHTTPPVPPLPSQLAGANASSGSLLGATHPAILGTGAGVSAGGVGSATSTPADQSASARLLAAAGFGPDGTPLPPTTKAGLALRLDQRLGVKVSFSECQEAAARLAAFCERSGFGSLARVLDSYCRRRFRTKDDFLRHFALVLRESMFPKWESKVLHFMASLLGNGLVFYRQQVLVCLRVMFPDAQPETTFRLGAGGSSQPSGGLAASPAGTPAAAATPASDGALDDNGTTFDEGWIQPLLALLETPLAPEATKVLDEVLEGRVALDETNLSLVFGNKTMHKIAREVMETSAVTSLHLADTAGLAASTGSVPPSVRGGTSGGWRVKDPAKAASVAKYNMSGVSMTCAGGHAITSREVSPMPMMTPEEVEAVLLERLSKPMRPLPTPPVQVSQVTLATHASQTSQSQPPPRQRRGSVSGRAQGHRPLPPVPDEAIEDIDDESLAALIDELGEYFEEKSRIYLQTSAGSADSQSTLLGVAPESGPVDAAPDAGSGVQPVMLFPPSTPLGSGLQPASSAHSLALSSAQSSSASLPNFASAAGTSNSSLGGKPAPATRDGAGTITPAQRLLSKPNARVTVSLRINQVFQETLKDPEFGHWVRTDIKTCLRLPQIECVELVKIEPVLGPAESESGAAGAAPVALTLVVVAIRGPRLANGFESAAYAEELCALVSRDFTGDGDEERRLLLSGVVMYAVDTAWTPELCIDVSGLIVPYVPEGLRSLVPHRARSAGVGSLAGRLAGSRSPTLRQRPATQMQAPTQPPTPHTQHRRVASAYSLPSDSHLQPTDLAGALTIFASSVELCAQLQADFIDLVEQTLPALGVDPRGAGLEQQVAAARASRFGPDAFVPVWAGAGVAEALRAAQQELEKQEQASAGATTLFLERRWRAVQAFNRAAAECIVARQAVDEATSGALAAAAAEQLGRRLQALHGRVLELASILDEVAKSAGTANSGFVSAK